MINISSNDLKSFDKVNSGNFGCIYKKDNYAYKVYNEYVKTNVNCLIKNPMLCNKFTTINKLKKMKKLNDKINNTDLISDILYIDNKFRGVVLPYYDGLSLYDLNNININEKIKYAKKVLSNAKELTNNFIYPMDYKLINIMTYKDEIKIIDLDDVFTELSYFYNPIFYRESVITLDLTIKAFFNEDSNRIYSREISSKLKRIFPCYNYSYKDIEKYINSKEEKHLYIFVDDKTNIDNYIELLRDNNNRVLFVNKNKYFDVYYLNKIIDFFNSNNIYLYDIVNDDIIDEYLNDLVFDNCLNIKDNNLLKLKL